MVHDGLWCAFEDVHMGEEAEIVADKYQISREAQDQFAYQSHMKANEATEAGRFHDEMVPVEIPAEEGHALVVDRDESIRPDTSIEALGKLNPVFRKEAGTVTAGNAPGLNDGGAATVVASEAIRQSATTCRFWRASPATPRRPSSRSTSSPARRAPCASCWTAPA